MVLPAIEDCSKIIVKSRSKKLDIANCKREEEKRMEKFQNSTLGKLLFSIEDDFNLWKE